jgi:hypothetical protein
VFRVDREEDYEPSDGGGEKTRRERGRRRIRGRNRAGAKAGRHPGFGAVGRTQVAIR